MAFDNLIEEFQSACNAGGTEVEKSAPTNPSTKVASASPRRRPPPHRLYRNGVIRKQGRQDTCDTTQPPPPANHLSAPVSPAYRDNISKSIRIACFQQAAPPASCGPCTSIFQDGGFRGKDSVLECANSIALLNPPKAHTRLVSP